MVLNDAVSSIIDTRANVLMAAAFQASSLMHVKCVPQQKQLHKWVYVLCHSMLDVHASPQHDRVGETNADSQARSDKQVRCGMRHGPWWE